MGWNEKIFFDYPMGWDGMGQKAFSMGRFFRPIPSHSEPWSGPSTFQKMAADILPKIDRDKCHFSLMLDYITPLNR